MAFGLPTFRQAGGKVAASAVAGVLWTAASPTVAFAYLLGWMTLAIAIASLAWPARSPPSANAVPPIPRLDPERSD